MPLFVVLGKWTDQGIRSVQNVPERAKKAKSMFEKAGGKMQIYYTLGKFDFVGIVDVPKDEDVAQILLCIGSMGNIRTITMKAWSDAEFEKMVSGAHSYEDNAPL